MPPGHSLVLAPSHRSYFDFLLSSYLCFQHPELGIRLVGFVDGAPNPDEPDERRLFNAAAVCANGSVRTRRGRSDARRRPSAAVGYGCTISRTATS